MNREEAERLLIAEAIKRGNISFLVSQNIDPTFFKPFKSIVEGLWRKVDALGGRTPSLKSAQQSFPEFDFTPTDEQVDVDEALEITRKAHARDKLHRKIMDLKPLLQEEDGWLRVLKEFPHEFSNIENILENTAGKDFAEDSLERHEYVRQRAIQREQGNWKVNFAHEGLNDHFGGYEPGFYMYVARTGKGKTWTCLLDLWWSWMQGANVGLFSLEMDFHKVGLRLDTFESHFSNFDLNRGVIRKDSSVEDKKLLKQQEKEYTEYLERIKQEAEEGKRGKFRIWPQDIFNTSVTPRRIEALIRDEGLDFVVIDQLELMDADSGVSDERLRLNEVSRQIKLIAGRLNIPILVPHQMNRETVKAKEVTDANIAGSDGPARHADFVCYLTRDEESKIMFYNFLKGRNAPINKPYALEWDWNTGHYKPVDAELYKLHQMSGLNQDLQDEDEKVLLSGKAENW